MRLFQAESTNDGRLDWPSSCTLTQGMSTSRAGLAMVLPLAAVLSGLTGRVRQPEPTAEELTLGRQVEGLRVLVADAERGKLFDFDQMLVVVDQRLVQELLASVVPLEGDVGGGFHVRIDAAQATFGDGLALVNLAGEVRLVDRSAAVAAAVYGGLDVVEVDPESGMLRATVKVFAVEIPEEADLLGIEEPARRLMLVLAEGGLERLLGPIEVPVRVADRLSFPPVRAHRVRIAGMEQPVVAEVSSVRAFAGKLWVALRGHLPDSPRAKCRHRTGS
jgi:hypothetical protein